MTDGSAIPVVIGLSAGIAFLNVFALAMNTSNPTIQQPVATELPQVKLMVLDASNEKLSYSGERGTYCWGEFGCADTGIIISNNSISLAKGNIIRFEFLDSYHDNRAPDELAVVAFDLHNDLKVIGATKGKVDGDVEIAMTDMGSTPIPYLLDDGNRNYTLDLAEGEYVLWAQSAWHPDGKPTIDDGDVSYFYRITVK